MAVKTQLTAELVTTHTKTVDGHIGTFRVTTNFSDSLADGTTIDKADLFYSKTAVAISGSGTNNLDLAGVLSDKYGTTITAVRNKSQILRCSWRMLCTQPSRAPSMGRPFKYDLGFTVAP